MGSRLSIFSLAWLLVIGLLIGKLVGVVLRGPSVIEMDASYYWDLGGLVQDGDWLLMQRPIAFRTPGYPWFVGLIRSLFGRPLMGLVIVQSLLWLATVGLAVWIAVDLSRRKEAGLIAGALAVVQVSSAVYVTAVLTETLFVFCLMLNLWSVMRLAKNPHWGWAIASGAFLGLTILTRPIAILLWVIHGLFVLINRESSQTLKRRMVLVAVSLLTTLVCVTPWLVRNHRMFGEVMLTEFVGRNVWIVAFQDGSGAGFDWPETTAANQLSDTVGADQWRDMIVEQSWRHTWTVSKALVDAGMTDPEADRLMKRVAMDAIERSPSVFAKKAVRRSVNFWRTRATELPHQVADLADNGGLNLEAQAESFAGNPVWGHSVPFVDWLIRTRFSNWLSGNTFLFALLLASLVAGIGFGPSRWAMVWLALVLAYFCSVTSLLEIPAYRYRMILEPIMLAVIAAMAAFLLPKQLE